jgi:dihydropteroate synthase
LSDSARATPRNAAFPGTPCHFAAPAWRLGAVRLAPQRRPLVMGILNLTPDSFYPDSRRPDPAAAVRAAMQMVADGADLLDLGAESSRPGSEPVGAEQERQRLLPVLEALRRQTDIPLTVDTTRAETARLALEAGADGVNDISAGRADPSLLPLVARRRCGLVLMHMLGDPKTMQDDPRYDDVVHDVKTFLRKRCAAAEAAGVAPEAIAVDPGIGFGKRLPHNLSLLAGLKTVAAGRPLLVGASRKSFIEHLTGAPVERRLPGSLAALAHAYAGGATVVRVHDVADSVQFLETLAAIAQAAAPPGAETSQPG